MIFFNSIEEFSNYNPLDFQNINELNRNILMTPDRKIIYLSIPKCACSSIKYFLRKNYGDDISKIKENVHDTTGSKLINYSKITQHNSLKEILLKSKFFIFSVIRSPKQRVLSAYLNKFHVKSEPLRSESRLIFGRGLFKGDLSDKDVLDKVENITFKKFLKIISEQKNVEKNEHWRPMICQLIGLPLYKINLYTFSSLDKLKLDIEDTLSTKLDFDTTLKFGSHQTSSSAQTNKYYDQETYEIFNNIYRDDIDLYESIQFKNSE